MHSGVVAVAGLLGLISNAEDKVKGEWDCGSRKKPPEISLPSSGDADRFPKNSFVEFVDDAGVLRRWFDCLHDKPVEWLMDLHPSRDKFGMTRSISQKLNGSSPSYSSYFVLLYTPEELDSPTLFICADPCGAKSYVEVSPGKYSITPVLRDSPSSPLWEDMAKRILERRPMPTLPPLECEMVLEIHVDVESDISYRWRSNSNNSIKIVKEITTSALTRSGQGIYFRNLYRSIPHDKRCVERLKECGNCKRVRATEDQDEEATRDVPYAVAFYARSNSLSPFSRQAFKGVLSLTSPRAFLFSWELSLEDMIALGGPAPLYYVGQVVPMTCNVSTLYFALGTELRAPNAMGAIVAISEVRELWRPQGYRSALVNLTMLSEGSVELVCSAPLWDWSRRIEKRTTFVVEAPITPEISGRETFLEIQLEAGRTNNNLTLECVGIGKPLPSLEWSVPNADTSQSITTVVLDNITIFSTLLIPFVTPEDLGTYTCTLGSDFGSAVKTFRLSIPDPGISSGVKIALSTSFSLLVLGALLLWGLLYRRILRQRAEYKTKMQEAIKEFKEGMVVRSALKKVEDNQHLDKSHSHNNYHNSILELPYNAHYEVARDKWEIEDKILGQGAFGLVKRGLIRLDSQQHPQPIAVKMLKGSVEVEDFKAFLTELKIMAYIGYHPNVVSLVAACTQDIEQQDVMIGVEFCTNGSLQDYLGAKRNLFMPSSEAPEVASRKTYANLSNPVALTELDLYTWSYQIAKGMEFLAGRKVLHGDLAIRNILLTSDKKAKISDFGLSRVLIDATNNYTKKSRVPLPWKWMASESLKALKFSTASDVWSFGVVLWEIFTLGEVPYGGLSFGAEFIQALDNGMRLGKPELATDYVYNIMNHCWAASPDARVTFSQLSSAFEELLDDFNNPDPGDSSTRSERRLLQLQLQLNPTPTPRSRTRAHNHHNNLNNLYSNRPFPKANLYLNV